ncbi:unnamed protein product [Cyprideis torosa]|uniref:Uncharacterized protein n=1 Tax=Cyprideis torosa TaxID=163714 RepID=A0A7R8ZKE4_9CRUS|nr:unnamed protein product [Cyprideis torosa]CAG0881569.1 unnamed protein product [Cyprideis torosa]
MTENSEVTYVLVSSDEDEDYDAKDDLEEPVDTCVFEVVQEVLERPQSPPSEVVCLIPVDEADEDPEANGLRREGHTRSYSKVILSREEHACHICGKVLSNRFSLQRHLSSHAGVRPFKCKICSKSFTSRGALVRHIEAHYGWGRLLCPSMGCGARFRQRYSLECHLRWHSGEKPFACACGQRFSQKVSLQRHLRPPTMSDTCEDVSEPPSTTVPPEEGNRVSSYPSLLEASTQTAFPETSPGDPVRDKIVNRCCFCSDVFPTEERLKDHVRQMHQLLPECCFCGMGYETFQDLKCHIASYHFNRSELIKLHAGTEEEINDASLCQRAFPDFFRP